MGQHSKNILDGPMQQHVFLWHSVTHKFMFTRHNQVSKPTDREVLFNKVDAFHKGPGTQEVSFCGHEMCLRAGANPCYYEDWMWQHILLKTLVQKRKISRTSAPEENVEFMQHARIWEGVRRQQGFIYLLVLAEYSSYDSRDIQEERFSLWNIMCCEVQFRVCSAYHNVLWGTVCLRQTLQYIVLQNEGAVIPWGRCIHIPRNNKCTSMSKPGLIQWTCVVAVLYIVHMDVDLPWQQPCAHTHVSWMWPMHVFRWHNPNHVWLQLLSV